MKGKLAFFASSSCYVSVYCINVQPLSAGPLNWNEIGEFVLSDHCISEKQVALSHVPCDLWWLRISSSLFMISMIK